MRRSRLVWEGFVERMIQIAGVLAIVFVVMIFLFLLRAALPLFGVASVGEFMTGTRWSPTADPPQFGLLPLLLGSLYVTFGALVIAVPLGLACAIFTSEVAPRWLREVLKPAVELLAAIPSVVFGFLGLILIGPWLSTRLDLPISMFAALGSLLLAFMAIPTIVSISEDAMRAVPDVLRQNSLALGATHWQTISRVVVPAARSGILAAILLGLGRAIGARFSTAIPTVVFSVVPRARLACSIRNWAAPPVRMVPTSIRAPGPKPRRARMAREAIPTPGQRPPRTRGRRPKQKRPRKPRRQTAIPARTKHRISRVCTTTVSRPTRSVRRCVKTSM